MWLIDQLQGWRKQVGRVGARPPRFWQNRKRRRAFPELYIKLGRTVWSLFSHCAILGARAHRFLAGPETSDERFV